jgi:hypothetical protein
MVARAPANSQIPLLHRAIPPWTVTKDVSTQNRGSANTLEVTVRTHP